MKRLILAGVLLLALAMAMSPTTLGFSTYTSSQRDTVRVVFGTAHYRNADALTPALYFDGNATLPWILGDMNRTVTRIAIHAMRNISVTIKLNANVVTSHHITNNTWYNRTLANAITATPVIANDTYMHVNMSFNDIHYTATFYMLADQPSLRTAWLSSIITYAETDKADPKVATQWTVNDTLTFGSLFDNITNVNLKLSYSDSVVSSSPDLYPWNGTGIDDGSILYVDYQKYGPAHDLQKHDVEEEITGTTHTVTVTFNSNDKLKKALWNIDFTDEVWDGKFATVNATSLTIKVNGELLDASDWTMGSLDMTNLAIDNDDNTIIFKWTVPTAAGAGAGAIAPPTNPLTTQYWVQEWGTVPYWAVAAIVIIIVLAIILVYYVETNRKKK